MPEARTVRLRIKRQDGPREPSYWQEFQLAWRPHMNVISALMAIQKKPITATGEKVKVPPEPEVGDAVGLADGDPLGEELAEALEVGVGVGAIVGVGVGAAEALWQFADPLSVNEPVAGWKLQS